MCVFGFNSLRKYWSLVRTVWENIDPWIQQSDEILVLGFNRLRKYWYLVPTVWENSDPWFQQSEKKIGPCLHQSEKMFEKKLELGFKSLRKYFLWFQQSEKILVLVFNSLRKYWPFPSPILKMFEKYWNLVSTVWKYFPWFQQSEKILVVAFNSVRKYFFEKIWLLNYSTPINLLWLDTEVCTHFIVTYGITHKGRDFRDDCTDCV